MKQRCILGCLLTIFSLLIIPKFLSKEQVKSSFSPVATNPTNLIDISKLIKEDYKQVFEGNFNDVQVKNEKSSKQVYYHDKPIRSFKLSPTENKAIFSYHLDDASDEELSLILIDLDTGAQREVFHTTFASWDVTSNPQWLGDKYLFFLRHCGTACQGVTLLNIDTGMTKNAVLSYSSFPEEPETTFFKDWFGKEYWMKGFVREIRSETSDNNPYLIFFLEDGAGKNLGEKRISFSNLKEDTLLLEKL